MPDDLLQYYQDELTFVRRMGARFAEQYRAVASRLQLTKDQCEDPHVERLIEAFALIAARIHRKLDDELPEITDALLEMIYPHALAPVPSMSIAQFVAEHDRASALTQGHCIEAGTLLYPNKHLVGDTPCRFRTCYPVELYPVEVVSVRFEEPDRHSPAEAIQVLRLGLRCQGGVRFADLTWDHLRFYLHGENPLVYGLYELLFVNVCGVQCRPPHGQREPAWIVLADDALRQVGFEADENILPDLPRAFRGYRLLQEYFAFPKKFLFVDLCDLQQVSGAGYGEEMDVLFFLKTQARCGQPSPDTFRLGCTPIVNLFERTTDPIRVSHARTEYQVIPDARRQDAYEVYTVNQVVLTSPYVPGPITVQPFYSMRYASDAAQPQTFWFAARRPAQQPLPCPQCGYPCPDYLHVCNQCHLDLREFKKKTDPGTEVYLSLIDPDFQPKRPPLETLVVQSICTNRHLPGQLWFGEPLSKDMENYFDMEGAAPVSARRCLVKPTATLHPSLRHGAQWRLISRLSLNYLSIHEVGLDALREILRLHNVGDVSNGAQQIAGITAVSSAPTVARLIAVAPMHADSHSQSKPWHAFCRGLDIRIMFDETKFVGSCLFLFASVLERFLGLYTSLNSFTQLTMMTEQHGMVKQWPPRAGDQILL
jgi:type VI secretion system protein ImpG